MTQPRTETIELTRGDDYSATVTFDQPVSSFSEMRFTIREDWATSETDNSSAVFTALLTPSGTYTAELAVPHVDAVGLSKRRYVHDIQVTTSSTGKQYTTQRGPVFVGPDVTR